MAKFIGVIIVIIGLILLIYGGFRVFKLILKREKKTDRKTLGIVASGILISFLGMVILPESESSKNKREATSEEVEDIEEVAKKEFDKKEGNDIKNVTENDLKSGDFYQYIAEKVAGTESSHGLPRVESASYNDVNGNTVTFKMNGDNMTKNLTKVGILKDSTEIMENMKVAGYEGNVIFVWFLPLENQYGEVDNIKSLAFTISKETFNRIDFNNFNRDNIPVIADEYFEHDVLKK